MRARNIKPALFKNELLGGADPLITILFEGLWCAADREGRLEDRPHRLKAEIFPYRPAVDVDKMLDWLAKNGFIERYDGLSTKVIQVVKFLSHQRPHHNEVKSVLATKVASASNQGKHRFALIPDPLLSDSGSLIPDTPLQESGGAGGKLNGSSNRGSRLPLDWQPTAEMVHFAEELQLDPLIISAKFRDYWISVPGQKGRKLDWLATWRNWCRENHDRKTGANRPTRKTRFDELKEQLNVEGEEDPFR